jgi:hypothetical protein
MYGKGRDSVWIMYGGEQNGVKGGRVEIVLSNLELKL